MFPEMSGFSPRNLKYMRKLAEQWNDLLIVQQVVAQIPWRSNILLLNKVADSSGTLNMYQNVVNDDLRHPDDNPTIGLLLVKGKNKTVVEYSLAGFRNPIGVADWQDKLEKELPDDLKSSLPTVEEIEKEMEKGECSAD
jgi:hypothetical protein